MSTALLIVSSLAAPFSALVLVTSLTTIPLLRQYEPATKKAAEYTQVAADKLQKTRLTHGAALGTAAFSLISTLYLMSHPQPGMLTLTLSAGNITAALWTGSYMHNFWFGDMAAVPGIGPKDWNEAVKGSRWIAMQLRFLGYAWVVVTLVGAWASTKR